MSRFSYLTSLLLMSIYLVGGQMSSQTAIAQQPPQAEAPAADAQDQEWYYNQGTKPIEKKSIAREKSVKRAEQRMARLEAMRWYGFSAGRPTAAAMPFTSMYSPAWSRPGGRPFAWYTGHRPPYTPRYVYYR